MLWLRHAARPPMLQPSLLFGSSKVTCSTCCVILMVGCGLIVLFCFVVVGMGAATKRTSKGVAGLVCADCCSCYLQLGREMLQLYERFCTRPYKCIGVKIKMYYVASIICKINSYARSRVTDSRSGVWVRVVWKCGKRHVEE
ncbi:hypothetical protein M758_UG304000 [Ceratodon purpureus]|nr:hypothetical protein M758_UG304000 [Ceratodon purpureus]